MIYPSIKQYISSLEEAEDNLATRTELELVKRRDGTPVMTSGNFAVVFKMRDKSEGRLYAVKCFIKDQPHRAESYSLIAEELKRIESPSLLHLEYLEKELYVDMDGDEEEFPVVLMEWIEGETLDVYIRRLIRDGDDYGLRELSISFNRMVLWLENLPIAHGDLKHDNILVKADGTLVLVDYDGMYVPAMKGQKAREIGSPDYRHPLRTEDDFDEHIDDFTLAMLALTLKALSVDSSLLERYGASDRLLFCASDYRHPETSELLKALLSLSFKEKMADYFALYLTAWQRRRLSEVNIEWLPVEREEEILSTKVTDEDRKNGVRDKFGVLYSKDGKRLLSGYKVSGFYSIKPGTKVICDHAFLLCRSLTQIGLPSGLTTIGTDAFYNCRSLTQIELPPGVTTIGARAFSSCRSLTQIELPSGLTTIGDHAFTVCSRLRQIELPSGVTTIGTSAFAYCNSLHIISHSRRFTVIEDVLYSSDKKKLLFYSPVKTNTSFIVPSSVTTIGASAFFDCSSLTQIELPSGLTTIGRSAFSCCSSLTQIELPSGLTTMGEWAFCDCRSLTQIELPSGLTTIGEGAFAGCSLLHIISHSRRFTVIEDVLYTSDKKELLFYSPVKTNSSFKIPSNVTTIGDHAFDYCSSLRRIKLPSGVTTIGNDAFRECKSLRRIKLPSGVTAIGNSAFDYCSSLRRIKLPSGLTTIGNSAFDYCSSLRRIKLPSGVTTIGAGAFGNCNSLHITSHSRRFTVIEDVLYSSDMKELLFYSPVKTNTSFVVPSGVTAIGDEAFYNCSSLAQIEFPSGLTTIGDRAFSGCESLTQIKLPSSLTTIGYCAFGLCSSLKRIIVPLGAQSRFAAMLDKELVRYIIEENH